MVRKSTIFAPQLPVREAAREIAEANHDTVAIGVVLDKVVPAVEQRVMSVPGPRSEGGVELPVPVGAGCGERGVDGAADMACGRVDSGDEAETVGL